MRYDGVNNTAHEWSLHICHQKQFINKLTFRKIWTENYQYSFNIHTTSQLKWQDSREAHTDVRQKDTRHFSQINVHLHVGYIGMEGATTKPVVFVCAMQKWCRHQSNATIVR